MKKLSLETKQKLFFSEIKFLVKSLQEMPKYVVLFPSAIFATFYHPTFAALIQGQRLAIISNLVISVVAYGFPRLNSFCHTAVLPMKVKDESPYCCYVILQVSKCFRLQVKHKNSNFLQGLKGTFWLFLGMLVQPSKSNKVTLFCTSIGTLLFRLKFLVITSH